MNKPITSQREHKIYLNMCWPTHASKNIKYNSTCIKQTPSMPASTLNASQHVWPKSLNARVDTKCISTSVDQTQLMPAITQNQYELTKSITCQRADKMNLNMCWPTHVCKNIKCISTCVEQTPPMPARTLNASQFVWPKSLNARVDTKCISTCVEQIETMPARR